MIWQGKQKKKEAEQKWQEFLQSEDYFQHKLMQLSKLVGSIFSSFQDTLILVTTYVV